MKPQARPHGQIRQSQIVTTFGPGAMVDLPDHAAIIGGLEHWRSMGRQVHEERLEAKVQTLRVFADQRILVAVAKGASRQTAEMPAGAIVFGSALRPDLKIPMIATRDIGVYAAGRLLKLDFSGKSTRELLGPRDVTRTEITSIIGRAIGKPDLSYVQFTYAQMEQALEQKGVTTKTAQMYVEMMRAFNEGVAVGEEPRSAANTTPTTFEQFAQEVFAAAYRGRAASA